MLISSFSGSKYGQCGNDEMKNDDDWRQTKRSQQQAFPFPSPLPSLLSLPTLLTPPWLACRDLSQLGRRLTWVRYRKNAQSQMLGYEKRRRQIIGRTVGPAVLRFLIFDKCSQWVGCGWLRFPWVTVGEKRREAGKQGGREGGKGGREDRCGGRVDHDLWFKSFLVKGIVGLQMMERFLSNRVCREEEKEKFWLICSWISALLHHQSCDRFYF